MRGLVVSKQLFPNLSRNAACCSACGLSLCEVKCITFLFWPLQQMKFQSQIGPTFVSPLAAVFANQLQVLNIS